MMFLLVSVFYRGICQDSSDDQQTADVYLSTLIGAENLEILKSKGEISSIFKKGTNLKLIPETGEKTRIADEVKTIKPDIGVEVLSLYRLPADSRLQSGKDPVFLYNILRSISTLKGIEYYSASRKKMRIFYHDAFVIESPGKKNSLPDPLVDSIPVKSTLFSLMKDSSFGEYVCSVDYYFRQDVYIMEMSNVTQIWYFLIPLINPHKFKSYNIIIPHGGEVLFYGFSCLSTIDLFGLAESRIDSLYNRIKAVYNWFLQKYQ